MILTRIDHVILAVGDLARSARLFEQLGLSLTQPMRHMDAATENQVFFVGSDTSEFYVELLSVHDRDRALQTGRSDLLQAIDRGGLMRVMMEVMMETMGMEMDQRLSILIAVLLLAMCTFDAKMERHQNLYH